MKSEDTALDKVMKTGVAFDLGFTPVSDALADIESDEKVRPRLQDGITKLINAILAYNPIEDVDTVERAFVFACSAHAHQVRESGDPYILHPLEVATILADLELDSSTIIAGLLHDTVEDTGVTLDDIKKNFGPEVAAMVDGVTKLKQADFDHLQRDAEGRDKEEEAEPDEPRPELKKRGLTDAQKQAENLRKILLAVARDFRVMMIKLADRLHNMQTLGVKPPEKQRRIALETMQIYAPLAHRLGVGKIKWQLEDLSFKYLYPEQFAEVAEKVSLTRREREAEIAQVMDIIKSRLAEEGIRAQVQGRPKHLYSIYNKIKKQELDFSEIYDLTAVRVVVETVAECYQALGIVHDLWIPIQGLFSDYIAKPKPNMYQSLHTKVLGPRGEPLEVQIRTFEMHRTAEFGVAAHWQYKEGGGKPRDSFERKMAFMNRQLFDWHADNPTEFEYLRSVVSDLFEDQVFVFTPKGDVIDLPADSTPVDFAFRIHTRLGEHIVGAKINGRIAPLNTPLHNSDIVDVIQRANAQPSLDWLSFVKTSHARTKIRQFYRKAHYAQHVQKGREMLEREAQRLGVDAAMIKPEGLEKVIRAMNYVTADDLYAAVGNGQTAAQTVVNRVRDILPASTDRIQVGQASEGRMDITAGGVDEVLISRARCCSPLPGEDVVGYVTQGRGVALHTRMCKNLASLCEKSPERVIEISWRTGLGEKYPVPVKIEAFNRVGLLQDISSIFSASNVNIREAKVKQRANHGAVLELTPEVSSAEVLTTLMANVRKLQDVLEVYRVTSAGAPQTRTRKAAKEKENTPA